MKLKYLIIMILTLVGLAGRAQSAPNTYFPYPIVPDSVKTFQGRCDYLADHFWDFCEMSKAFSAKQKMANEMRTYMKIIANASADSAVKGMTALMKKLEKQPKDQLFLAEIAEGHLYGDTAQMWIDELYLPVAEAIASNKRISKAEKARYVQQAEVLRNSLIGQPAPSLPYTRLDGSQGNLKNDTAEVVIVFFNDPDCDDCSMTRLRLDADVSMTELINSGLVKVVSLSLCEPDDEWRKMMESYPKNWIVGAAPDADLTIDLRSGTPDFYVLGRNGNIWYKHLGINQLLDIARQLRKR
ncbi:MAG: DUF5106 domain-containing protein [Bacteroides sp.]|nr:DUF5106 domain-containing protein [Bacteroides sp.]MBD5332719.1 DUF5106 domain-containing protein [Bacteroides sp.]